MSNPALPPEFLALLRSITAKRPRTVIDHILQHGYITTEELKAYGYNHPPRAARDVREQGIPLETFRVKGSDGRSIAAYRFGDLTQTRRDRVGGRKAFSKDFKHQLLDKAARRCAICADQVEERYLQIDHRIPYEVSGDPNEGERHTADYMLLCGSCNRAKSWSCEHCANLVEKKTEVCRSCYWADPDDYVHIALRAVRRLDVVWTESETEVYEQLKAQAATTGQLLAEYIKAILADSVGPTDDTFKGD
ncbi:MAG: HNH endonuclease [Aggregatilineales bacterium]